MQRRKLIVALAAAAIGFAAAVSLGNWQTRRGDVKLALQAQADAAERAAPIEIASRASIEDAATNLPRKVRVSGVFDSSGTVYLDNRTLGGVAGYYVITPLLINDDLPAVLIDRGWKAHTMGEREKAAAPTPPPAGRVSIEGLAVARPSALFELGRPINTEVPGFWQNLDYAAYERATRRTVARFVVRQTHGVRSGAVDDLRREWPRAPSGVDKHRGYAFQWYALAALIAVLAAIFGWKAWRGR
jgi:surfeit locus 1 family protein